MSLTLCDYALVLYPSKTRSAGLLNAHRSVRRDASQIIESRGIRVETIVNNYSPVGEDRTAGAEEPALANRLSHVDWDFPKRERTSNVESIHPYPAKFIGEIPRALLDCFSLVRRAIVLDPFCGSGTTLVEAQRAGLRSVGVDLNPIACLISRVKTQPLYSGFEDAVMDVLARATRMKSITLPEIPNLDHWFKSDVQRAVGALFATLIRPEYVSWIDPLRLALSSILVRVSNQDSDTRYAAIEKPVTELDVFKAFGSASRKIQLALSGRPATLPSANVIEADTLAVTPSQVGSVDAVITSPPYPNAYEYWLYHKYRMWWLGFDPIAVKEREIGARAHFFKKNHHTASLFHTQMAKAFSLIDDVLTDEGLVAFVVGRSKIHGAIVDNGEIITKVADQAGFVQIFHARRSINPNRKSFNLSHANIKTESVLVFRRR